MWQPGWTWGYYAKQNKSEKKIQYDFTYMWNLKNKQTKKEMKWKQTHGYREQMGDCKRGGENGALGKIGERN